MYSQTQSQDIVSLGVSRAMHFVIVFLLPWDAKIRCKQALSHCLKLLLMVTSGLCINLPVPSEPQEPGVWRLRRSALPPNGALWNRRLTIWQELHLDTRCKEQCVCYVGCWMFESEIGEVVKRTVDSWWAAGAEQNQQLVSHLMFIMSSLRSL